MIHATVYDKSPSSFLPNLMRSLNNKFNIQASCSYIRARYCLWRNKPIHILVIEYWVILIYGDSRKWNGEGFPAPIEVVFAFRVFDLLAKQDLITLQASNRERLRPSPAGSPSGRFQRPSLNSVVVIRLAPHLDRTRIPQPNVGESGLGVPSVGPVWAGTRFQVVDVIEIGRSVCLKPLAWLMNSSAESGTMDTTSEVESDCVERSEVGNNDDCEEHRSGLECFFRLTKETNMDRNCLGHKILFDSLMFSMLVD
ncbi:hypothetical protein LZ30DRAFT_694841 [Colletotrichum cereale]|nr:hypothetical protein LZ30DRAFT_694841 [Colletotrichum cereale]